ncbi:MAG: hypothetical protein WAN57_01915 [Smithella sp.]
MTGIKYAKIPEYSSGKVKPSVLTGTAPDKEKSASKNLMITDKDMGHNVFPFVSIQFIVTDT